MKAAIGTPTGSRSGQRHARLERRDRVVGQRADGPAGEAGHALDRQDPAARHERADGRERVRGGGRLAGQARVVGRDGHGPGLDVGLAVADLEEPARTDAQERVPPEALAALHGFEEIGRAAVVEAEQGADRGLEVGRTGRPQQDRVGGTREALRLRQTERIGCGHPGEPLRIKNGQSSQGRKAEPSAVPPSFGVCRTHWIPGSRVHSLVVVIPARTNRRVSGSTPRRVLVPFTARSSRCGREYGRVAGDPSSGSARAPLPRHGDLEASAGKHWQRRVAREAWVRPRPLAQDEDAPPVVRDGPCVAAADDRARRRAGRGVRAAQSMRRSLDRTGPSSGSSSIGLVGATEPAAGERQPGEAAGDLHEDDHHDRAGPARS